MDFALSEEQDAIFQMAREFGAEHIAPHARAWEDEGTIPRALWPQAGRAGLRRALCLGRDAGGTGLTRLDAALVFEALSMACPSVAAFLSRSTTCAPACWTATARTS